MAEAVPVAVPVALPEASSLDVVTEALGPDLVFRVFTFASRYDLPAVACVCRAWRRIVGDPLLAQPPRRLLGYVIRPPVLAAEGKLMVIHRRALDACCVTAYAGPPSLARVYARFDNTRVDDTFNTRLAVRICGLEWATYHNARAVGAWDVELADVDAQRAATLLTGTATLTFLLVSSAYRPPLRAHTTTYVAGVAFETAVATVRAPWDSG
jgi:hypothetical protein